MYSRKPTPLIQEVGGGGTQRVALTETEEEVAEYNDCCSWYEVKVAEYKGSLVQGSLEAEYGKYVAVPGRRRMQLSTWGNIPDRRRM